MYDPRLGRFLSADPVMLDPANGQALNAYSYVGNNPLSATDPTGLFLKRLFRSIGRFFKRYWRPILAIALAVVTYGAATKFLIAKGLAAGAWSTSALAGAAAGTVSGAVVGGVRGAVIGGIGGFLSGAVAGHFGTDWSVNRLLADGLASGATSELGGGKFSDGFRIGVGTSLLNWGAVEMRRAEIAASRRSSLDRGGRSAGWIGDDVPTKLGGGRSRWGVSELRKVPKALFGGQQGGKGYFLGLRYSPGSPLDSLVEAYAGPHDWLLRNYSSYNGQTTNLSLWGKGALLVQSGVMLAPATIFVGAQVAPALPFGD